MVYIDITKYLWFSRVPKVDYPEFYKNSNDVLYKVISLPKGYQPKNDDPNYKWFKYDSRIIRFERISIKKTDTSQDEVSGQFTDRLFGGFSLNDIYYVYTGSQDIDEITVTYNTQCEANLRPRYLFFVANDGKQVESDRSFSWVAGFDYKPTQNYLIKYENIEGGGGYFNIFVRDGSDIPTFTIEKGKLLFNLK